MAEQPPALPDVIHLFDGFPCGLLVTSTTGTILWVNQTLCGWLGMSATELVGHVRLQDLFTMGGRIFHQTHWVPTLEMQGSLAEVKYDVRCKGGRVLPMMLNAVRRRALSGDYDQVTLTVAEERNKYERELVEARRRADELLQKERLGQRNAEVGESRLRQAVRVGALFLWDVDPATSQRRFEHDVARLLGHSEPRTVDEQAFESAIVATDRAAEMAAFEAALCEPDRVHNWTFRLHGVDGVERVIFSSGQAFLNEDGSLFQFVGVLSDITRITLERASAEDRALFAEQMVGIVSHDLRNPLATITVGAAFLARGDDLPPKKARMLKQVSGSAQRARRLVEDLLDFTQARIGGGLTVAKRQVNIHEVVARALDELRIAYPARTITHRTSGEGACSADPDRVAQLLGNLVSNAITYGDIDGDVTVTSSVADAVRISVHNVGMPIPPGTLESMFEPMVRGAAIGTSVRSVGLGLFIVRAIARAHGGEVSARSEAAEGTTFEFAFPHRPRIEF